MQRVRDQLTQEQSTTKRLFGLLEQQERLYLDKLGQSNDETVDRARLCDELQSRIGALNDQSQTQQIEQNRIIDEFRQQIEDLNHQLRECQQSRDRLYGDIAELHSQLATAKRATLSTSLSASRSRPVVVAASQPTSSKSVAFHDTASRRRALDDDDDFAQALNVSSSQQQQQQQPPRSAPRPLNSSLSAASRILSPSQQLEKDFPLAEPVIKPLTPPSANHHRSTTSSARVVRTTTEPSLNSESVHELLASLSQFQQQMTEKTREIDSILHSSGKRSQSKPRTAPLSDASPQHPRTAHRAAVDDDAWLHRSPQLQQQITEIDTEAIALDETEAMDLLNSKMAENRAESLGVYTIYRLN